MVVHIDRLIRHLKAQIAVADDLKSEFVYITKNEAKRCLELAEAEEVIMDMYSEINERKQQHEKAN